MSLSIRLGRRSLYTRTIGSIHVTSQLVDDSHDKDNVKEN